MPTDTVVAALVGAASTLLVILIKDVVVAARRERRARRLALARTQMELVYAPLEYLVVTLLGADAPAQKDQARAAIGDVLRQHSYLLSEATTGALYTLLDDETTGARMLQASFFPEYAALKARYYGMHASAPPGRRSGAGSHRAVG